MEGKEGTERDQSGGSESRILKVKKKKAPNVYGGVSMIAELSLSEASQGVEPSLRTLFFVRKACFQPHPP